MRKKDRPSIKRIKTSLRNGIVEFTYKKKSTQKIRKAKGTLSKKLIPTDKQPNKDSSSKRTSPSDSVIYFDLDKNEFRSFKDYYLMRVKREKKNKNNLDKSK